jgi:hypothetical protein
MDSYTSAINSPVRFAGGARAGGRGRARARRAGALASIRALLPAACALRGLPVRLVRRPSLSLAARKGKTEATDRAEKPFFFPCLLLR